MYNSGVTGFSRGQGVPLHYCIHQLGASTNSNKCFLDYYYGRMHRPPIAAEWICIRMLAMAHNVGPQLYIPLQL